MCTRGHFQGTPGYVLELSGLYDQQEIDTSIEPERIQNYGDVSPHSLNDLSDQLEIRKELRRLLYPCPLDQSPSTIPYLTVIATEVPRKGLSLASQPFFHVIIA